MLSFTWNNLCLLFPGLTKSSLHILLLWGGVWSETPGFRPAFVRITVNQSFAQTRTKIESDLETKPWRTFSFCMSSTLAFLIQTGTPLKLTSNMHLKFEFTTK